MTIIAADSLQQEAVQSKHIIVPLIITDQTSITIDTTNIAPNLRNKVEIVNTAIAGTLVTEQTFTGANTLAATSVVGVGVIDGLAKGPVSGYIEILGNSGAANANTALPFSVFLPTGGTGGISGQTIAGVTSLGNVACLFTLTAAGAGGATTLNAAAGTGKAVLHLVWR
jgi:hypothetical protein